MDVMKTRKEKVIEESYGGKYYLSVKSPLVINDSVEGVMGISIDITDRKRAEELRVEKLKVELDLEKQKEL